MGHLIFYLVVIAMFAVKGEAAQANEAFPMDEVLLAQNNDVYNFYFQKGPAPATVIQGSTGQGTGAATLPSSTTIPNTAPNTAPPNSALQPEATTTVQLEVPKVFDPMSGLRYEIFLGGTRVSDDVGRADGYTFGGQYNFNRFIGLRAVAHYLDADTQLIKNQIGTRESYNRDLWGGQLALAVTPFHLQLFGHRFLKISALGGVRSDRQNKSETTDPNCMSGNPQKDCAKHVPRTTIAGFYGVSALFNINENFGVEASVASADGGRAAQVTGNLAFTF